MRKPVFGFPSRFDTNQAVYNMVRGLKLLIEEVEELYYLFSVTAQLICAFVFAFAKIRFSQKRLIYVRGTH